MKRSLLVTLCGLVLCAASPVSAQATKPENASRDGKFLAAITREVLRYAQRLESANSAMTYAAGNAAGLSKVAARETKKKPFKAAMLSGAKEFCAIAGKTKGDVAVAALAAHLRVSLDTKRPRKEDGSLSSRQAWEVWSYGLSTSMAFAPVGKVGLCPQHGDVMMRAWDVYLAGLYPLDASLGNPGNFLTSYGSSVVSVVCEGTTTSGVVLDMDLSPVALNAGMKSAVVTSQYGLGACAEGDFLDRRLTVRAGDTEYPALLWSWAEDKDTAVVLTAATLEPVRDFYGAVVPRPSVGDTAVVIWGQNGLAGRLSEAKIVLAESDFIYTSNKGPGEQLAGAAVFNNKGDLIGIVDSASLDTESRTVTVLPITRFCGNPYSTSCYIGWAS